jgi:hypothetical protein
MGDVRERQVAGSRVVRRHVERVVSAVITAKPGTFIEVDVPDA